MENLVLSSEEAKRLDNFAIQNLGIPSLVLMENAGRSLSYEILQRYPLAQAVLIFVYKGNNGGDGLVAARYLFAAGKDVKVVLLSDVAQLSSDSAHNFNIVQKLKIPVIHLADAKAKSGAARHGEASVISKIKTCLKNCDLVVDAIFGVGLSSPVKGFLAKVIEVINQAERPVKVAVDIPSGLDANTGKPWGVAVCADLTVTMGFVKQGLLESAARKYVGRVVVVDIGIPSSVLVKKKVPKVAPPAKVKEKRFNIITAELVSQILKRRPFDINKGDCGRVLIIAGSAAMSGAAVLSGGAALKGGAGLVYLAVPGSIKTVVQIALPEALVIELPESKAGAVCCAALQVLAGKLGMMDAILIGPGLTAFPETQEFFFAFMAHLQKNKLHLPVIIDADGLNCLSGHVPLLHEIKFPLVLTPHPGEFGRLIGRSADEVQNSRITLAQNFVNKYKVNLVLKGAHTICTAAKSPVFINLTGNPGLASGGTGDVLSGLMVALVGQRVGILDAARAAVFVHGLAGDILERQIGVFGLLASNVVETIPLVLKNLYRG